MTIDANLVYVEAFFSNAGSYEDVCVALIKRLSR